MRCCDSRRIFFLLLSRVGVRVLCGEAFAHVHESPVGDIGVCGCGSVTLLDFAAHSKRQDDNRKSKSSENQSVSE